LTSGQETDSTQSVSKQNKRLNTSSPDYFKFGAKTYEIDNNIPSSMAYHPPIPNPLNMTFMPPQPYMPFNVVGVQSISPPPWAADLINDMKQIKKSMSKIDSIEKAVNRVCLKDETL
jgi:hypothetical protein